MDPVTAFSLACGVIQIIDFSLRLLSKSRKIYKDGSLEGNDSLEYLSHHLRNLEAELQTTVGNNSNNQLLSQNEQDINVLAGKCSDTAQELLIELDKLKVSNPKKKSEAIRAALRTIRKKSALKEIEGRLSSYRNMLDTQILVELRKQIRGISLGQSDNFKKADEHLQKILLSFAEQSCSFEQLTKLINSESKSIRDFTSHEFEQLKISTAETKNQEDFLASVRFPEIDYRQEEINDVHEKTYQWIFDQSGAQVRPWSNFIEWLQEGLGIYWISGKAGSGKSTLMNYICQNQRTEDALIEWAGSRKLLMPTFFFWAAGSRLQKTVTGLLRSLIYQILRDNRSLITALGQRKIASGLQRDFPHGLEPITLLTEKKLFAYLSTLVEAVAESHSICFFVDGLDEFDGNHYELISMISKMTQRTGIKCCVSSRPERPFREFESSSMLRLQDLTRSDIREYVWSNLGNLPQLEHLLAKDHYLYIIEKLVDKADGVFLWVELVVKNQIIGIRYDDSFETLQQRLESLPSKVEDLYSDMLKRIDPAHYKEAAKYLYLALSSGKELSSVFAFTVAVYGLADDMRLTSEELDSNSIISKCPYVHDRINAICAGFLETSEHYSFPLYKLTGVKWLEWEQDSSLVARFPIDWSARKVKFCHRTAYDFFKNTDGSGLRFLNSNVPVILHEEFLRNTIELALMSMCNLEDSEYFMSRMVCNLFQRLQWAHTGWEDLAAPREFFEYVDRTLTVLDKRYNRPLDESRWDTRWLKRGPDTNHLEHRKIFDCCIDPTKNTVDNSPSDFLSLAASLELLEYVAEVLNKPDFNMNPIKATHLATCSMAQVTLWYGRRVPCNWKISSWYQFKFVGRMVRLGADPSKGRNWSIWEELVRFLYAERLRSYGRVYSEDPQITPGLVQTIEACLNTDIDPYPVIKLHIDLPLGRNAFYECDTSMVPLLEPILELHGSQFGLQLLQSARRTASSLKPLRIWFRDDQSAFSDFWPPAGHLMTDKQIRSLHLALQRRISCSKETQLERTRELKKAFYDIHEFCCSHYELPPHFSGSLCWGDVEDETDEEGEGILALCEDLIF